MDHKYSFLKSATVILFIISTIIYLPSCEKEENAQSNEDKNRQYFEGKWKVLNGFAYAINQNDDKITTAIFKPDVFAHEFFANGNYTGHDLVKNVSENGSWKLENIKEVNGEFEATLAITTPTLQGSKGELSIDADGYQRYYVAYKTKDFDDMIMISKKYKAYPYDVNWVEIFVRKVN
jgi:hypothetical protein